MKSNYQSNRRNNSRGSAVTPTNAAKSTQKHDAGYIQTLTNNQGRFSTGSKFEINSNSEWAQSPIPMNQSNYRNSSSAAMLKGSKQGAGTISSEEKEGNSDDFEELPSDAASEGNDDTYNKKTSTNINIQQNYKSQKEQGQQYDKIVEQSREHYDDSDSSGMDDHGSVGDELETCKEGKVQETQKTGVISYIKKKINGQSQVNGKNPSGSDAYEHHHDHTHVAVSDGRFTHLGQSITNNNKFKPRADRMPFKCPNRFKGIYKGMNEEFWNGFKNPDSLGTDFVEHGIQFRELHGSVKQSSYSHNKTKNQEYYKSDIVKKSNGIIQNPDELQVFTLVQKGGEISLSKQAQLNGQRLRKGIFSNYQTKMEQTKWGKDEKKRAFFKSVSPQNRSSFNMFHNQFQPKGSPSESQYSFVSGGKRKDRKNFNSSISSERRPGNTNLTNRLSMADKIQIAHRKITNKDTKTLREAFNSSQLSNNGYVSQRNLNISNVLHTEPSLKADMRRNRSQLASQIQEGDYKPNYQTNPTMERNDFDEQSPFTNTQDHANWYKKTSKKIQDNKKLLYQRDIKIDIQKHVEINTSILEYQKPRPLSPVFNDRKFKANVNGPGQKKFKNVKSKFLQTQKCVDALRQDAQKLKDTLALKKKMDQDRNSYNVPRVRQIYHNADLMGTSSPRNKEETLNDTSQMQTGRGRQMNDSLNQEQSTTVFQRLMNDQEKRKKQKQSNHENPFEDLGGKIRRKDTYQEVDYEGFLRSTKSPIRHERLEKQDRKGEYDTEYSPNRGTQQNIVVPKSPVNLKNNYESKPKLTRAELEIKSNQSLNVSHITHPGQDLHYEQSGGAMNINIQNTKIK